MNAICINQGRTNRFNTDILKIYQEHKLIPLTINTIYVLYNQC